MRSNKMETFKHAKVLILVGTVLCATSLLAVASLQGNTGNAASPAPSMNVIGEFVPVPEPQANLTRVVILPPSCSCRPRIGDEEYGPDAGWVAVGATRDTATDHLPKFE
jgi:hypothetical protein